MAVAKAEATAGRTLKPAPLCTLSQRRPEKRRRLGLRTKFSRRRRSWVSSSSASVSSPPVALPSFLLIPYSSVEADVSKPNSYRSIYFGPRAEP